VSPLEQRIAYEFRNPILLKEALTHPSIGHERRDREFDNQRLEFLGDAVLQLVITEYLYAHFRGLCHATRYRAVQSRSILARMC